MADAILRDVKEFLDDLVNELTTLHVQAASLQDAPTPEGTVDDLAGIPGALIDRAQSLRSRIGDDDDDDERAAADAGQADAAASQTPRVEGDAAAAEKAKPGDGEHPKPKAKAKPAAKRKAR